MRNSRSYLCFAILTLISSQSISNGMTTRTKTTISRNAPLTKAVYQSRRSWLFDATVLPIAASLFIILPASSAAAAETVGKDPECNDSQCLGVWDGLLANCPHDKLSLGTGAGCVSSQDDTPRIFAEPWDYSENSDLNWENQMRRLVPTIQLVSSRRGDKAEITSLVDRYLRVTFTDAKSGETSVGEFYFTPNDTTVQFRVGSLSSSSPTKGGLTMMVASSSSQRNFDRCESIRKEMGYLRLPVLRNRKRTLFFGESEFDTFGPGSASLGPPAEMTNGELEGRWDVDPRLKIDVLQGFPMGK